MKENDTQSMYELLIKTLKEKVYLETLIINNSTDFNEINTPVSTELYHSLKLEYTDKSVKSMQALLDYLNSETPKISELEYNIMYDFSNIVEYFVQIMSKITKTLPHLLGLPEVFMNTVGKSLQQDILSQIVESFHGNSIGEN